MTLRMDGGYGMPGMPGNGGARVAGGLSFPIGPGKPDVNEEQKFKEMFPNPGDWRQYIRDYQNKNRLDREMPSAGVGNVGGLMTQAYPMVGDTINMGPGEYDYSNMPVIPDPQEDQYQQNIRMEEYRNKAFPRPYQEYTNSGQYFAQTTPLIGIGGKTVS